MNKSKPWIIVSVLTFAVLVIGFGISFYVNNQTVYRDYLPEELRDFDAPTIYTNKTYGYQVTYPAYLTEGGTDESKYFKMSIGSDEARISISTNSRSVDNCYESEGYTVLNDVSTKGGVIFKQFYSYNNIDYYDLYIFRTINKDLCYEIAFTIDHEKGSDMTFKLGAEGIFYGIADTFKFTNSRYDRMPIKITAPDIGAVFSYFGFNLEWKIYPGVRDRIKNVNVYAYGDKSFSRDARTVTYSEDLFTPCCEYVLLNKDPIPAELGGYHVEISPGCIDEIKIWLRVESESTEFSDTIGPILLRGGACG